MKSFNFNIPEDDVIFESAGDTVTEFDENLAVGMMFLDKLLFINSIRNEQGQWQITFYVTCNDIFAWGMGDAEIISSSDIPSLFNLYLQDKEMAAAKWCCLKRNQQPQALYKQLMIDKGVWDHEMDKLPENEYDKRWRI